MGSRLEYRRELDGLRAVAVVPVILYHLGVPGVSGGFVGVDVFFVLSGFFITRQIAYNLDLGAFSLLAFYDRRIRRLFPALMAMLLCSTVLAFLLLLPHDLERFGSTLAAAALSVSNVQLWRMTDYFAPAAETLPLLHTWSLAVEEQFYIVFPLLMVAIWRLGSRRRILIVAAITMLSLALSIWGVWARPAASFYLLPTRAWELSLGSLLALGAVPPPRNEDVRRLAATVGLLAILAAVVTFTAGTPTPGLAALLPCLGCALVVWSGEGREASISAPSTVMRSTVMALLCAPPVVFIGLISYSLYLWHWPIIVFVRQVTIGHLSAWAVAAILALTFAAATLSWRYIEQPLRYGTTVWPASWQRFVYAAGAIAAAVGIGVGINIADGFPGRLPPEALAITRQVEDFSPLRKRCHADGRGDRTFDDTCVTGPPDGRSVVVLADSHGAELGYALWEQAERLGLNVRLITASGCPPSVDFRPPLNRACHVHVARMIAGLKGLQPATVIMMSYYAKWSEPQTREAFWQGYARAVELLRGAGHTVILLGPVPPHTAGRVPDALTKWVLLRRHPEAYGFAVDEQLMADIDRRLSELAMEKGAQHLPLRSAVCGASARCRAYHGGHAIYFDSDHITVSTARRVLRTVRVIELLDQASQPR